MSESWNVFEHESWQFSNHTDNKWIFLSFWINNFKSIVKVFKIKQVINFNEFKIKYPNLNTSNFVFIWKWKFLNLKRGTKFQSYTSKFENIFISKFLI